MISLIFSAEKIWYFSRSIIIYNSSNCATSLSVHMKYKCEPYTSFGSTYTQRYFVPRIYWLNNQMHSISGVPIHLLLCYKPLRKRIILLLLWTSLHEGYHVLRATLYLSCSLHFGREFLFTKHINLTHNFKSGTKNQKYLHSFESGLP